MFFSEEKTDDEINKIVDIKNNLNLTKFKNIKNEKILSILFFSINKF